ncbi:MAG: hypothetical protein EOP09_01180 [Proteobacteria bacterium]|nr:MAG: hypothetical protein EOP09_01180 [Pseudomonadota bacterium]
MGRRYFAVFPLVYQDLLMEPTHEQIIHGALTGELDSPNVVRWEPTDVVIDPTRHSKIRIELN